MSIQYIHRVGEKLAPDLGLSEKLPPSRVGTEPTINHPLLLLELLDVGPAARAPDHCVRARAARAARGGRPAVPTKFAALLC